MKISEKSWHYRWLRRCLKDNYGDFYPPKTICGYIMAHIIVLVISLIMLAFMGFIATMLYFLIPDIWQKLSSPSTDILGRLWSIVKTVLYFVGAVIAVGGSYILWSTYVDKYCKVIEYTDDK